ncbi:glycoside hydrolase superfamily [Desarmillaria tabescens]|uniref:Glycoside hydrolase superfamily n=1 Tax=Armillaria tabescens TaxID=1929756 RepID=A0AA39K1H9_ARMTA|nr:glycoside hydrolase superfamily [Desarmillaria tabescens]KAK0451434.1 glycoside hydrolase superfamily [Desarmillaria tabescens]
MLIQVLLLAFAFPNTRNGISIALAQSTTVASSSVASTTTIISSPTTVVNAASFPSVGSIPRDYTPEGLEQLWDIIGPVEPPPFTTTRVPTAADILPDLKFPKGFRYGVATSAYQIEGAVKNEGKGPTMWDWATRQPSGTTDNTTGDVVGLHYYLYKEDVERIAALGVTAHSFSISWARIYPFGAADSPLNTLGIDHYSDVIDYHHLAHNVEPVVSLFHWDTPVALQAYYGGFTSPQIVDDFIKHTATVLKLGSRSMNRAISVARFHPILSVNILPIKPYFGKLTLRVDVTLAPGVNSSTAPYQCAYNLLKAHAGAVKAFREMNMTGEIGFKNSNYIGTPWRSNSTEDALAVIGPTLVKDTLSEEYLPRFTDEEKSDLLGSADFFSITSYRSLWIKAPDEGLDACYISEFGTLEPFAYANADISQVKEDVPRTNCLLTYLGEMLLSIHEDGVPIEGAFAWTMIDDTEWVGGTMVRYGIQHVDYTTLERTYKRSALSLVEFFGSHLQD